MKNVISNAHYLVKKKKKKQAKRQENGTHNHNQEKLQSIKNRSRIIKEKINIKGI